MTYYAITVQQPYASLLIEGIKHYETRTWKVSSRLIGETIAIHAAKKSKLIRVVEEGGLVKPNSGLPESILARFHNLPLPMGQVLGLVKVIDCLEITTELLAKISQEEKAIGYWELGNYAWQLQVLENFGDETPFDDSHKSTNTLVRGQQGLWKWTSDNQQE